MSNMVIQHNVDLTKHNTFGFTQHAAHYVETTSAEQVEHAVRLAQDNGWPILPLGGGSNLVLTKDINALVIKQMDEDISYTDHGASGIHVQASAGFNWHSLVMHTVQRGHVGLENLSLIPGSVGAAPVQNIGAYGVELCDRFVSLKALHIPTLSWHTFDMEDCKFAYRDSLFKHQLDDYIITQVTLSLDGRHTLQTHYGALANYLQEHNQSEVISPQIVSDAVCTIRASKLPDPAVVPNAGSFFHNPVVSAEHYERLKTKFPNLVAYPQSGERYKLAAGWLIDQLGYKGYRQTGVGVHESQALVLIKCGPSDGVGLLALASAIRLKVKEVFDVALTIEPRIL